MLPQRSSSTSSSGMARSRRSPLISLRYEETVQAELPIPLPQRNPSRLRRSPSTRSMATVRSTATTATFATSPASASFSSPFPSPSSSPQPQSSSPTSASSVPSVRSKRSMSSLTASPITSQSASSSSCSSPTMAMTPLTSGPLVILRPPMLIAPPQEQHPALRRRSIRPIAEEEGGADEIYTSRRSYDGNVIASKHDSFLAPSSSTSTLRVNQMCPETETEIHHTVTVPVPVPVLVAATTPKSGHVTTRSDATSLATSMAVCASPTTREPEMSHKDGTTARVAPVAAAGKSAIGNISMLSVASVGSVTTTTTMVIKAAARDAAREKTRATQAKKPEVSPAPAPAAATARERTWRLPKGFSFRSSASTASSDKAKKRRSGFAGLFGCSENATATGKSSCISGGSGEILPQSTAHSTQEATPPADKVTKPRASWSVTSTRQNASKAADCTTTSAPLSPFSHDPCSALDPPPSSPSCPSALPASSQNKPLSPGPFIFRALSMSDPRRKHQSSNSNGNNRISISSSRPHPPPSAGPGVFEPISTAIPTKTLIEDEVLASLTFSHRGSLMLMGQRADVTAKGKAARSMAEGGAAGEAPPPAIEVEAASEPELLPPLPPAPRPRPRLSEDAERESHKVRSMYDEDDVLRWEDGQPPAAGDGDPSGQAATAPTLCVLASEPAPTPSSVGLSEDAAEGCRSEQNIAASRTLSYPASTARHSLHPRDNGLHHFSDESESRRASIVSVATTVSSTGAPLPRTPSLLLSPWSAGSDSATSSYNNNGNNSNNIPRRQKQRGEFELAGGLEDWEDVDVGDVDRFGFIQVPRRPHTTTAASGDSSNNEMLAVPSLHGRGGRSGRGLHNLSPSGATVLTQRSAATTMTEAARSSIRAAANLLPHNRDRKWLDEAGDMLTMSPGGMSDADDDVLTERLSEALKRKEWERSEKWRRMARIVRREGGDGDSAAEGGGTDYEFDPHHPKLVERTWKGIPDCWRAAAWYSFLASSARRHAKVAGERSKSGPGSVAIDDDQALIAAFHQLQQTSSPDDMQIDLDVPRTVGGHVMFRRRYRGGQRLLFRVLHALSLFCAAGTGGYVQGMASLAATLLCYYDEERCFVMLVRVFRLRGLERLYAPGFGGLVDTLADFEQQWLARNSQNAAEKLAALGIDTMAYATRWYLTLFNLSVPFAAQLRIWDVFMLLGDGEDALGADEAEDEDAATREAAYADTADRNHANTGNYANATVPAATSSLASGDLTILHATSAALVDALQDVLADADFENAMKALTSWIPIKNEDLLMKVVHAEWKRRQRQRRPR